MSSEKGDCVIVLDDDEDVPGESGLVKPAVGKAHNEATTSKQKKDKQANKARRSITDSSHVDASLKHQANVQMTNPKTKGGTKSLSSYLSDPALRSLQSKLAEVGLSVSFDDTKLSLKKMSPGQKNSTNNSDFQLSQDGTKVKSAVAKQDNEVITQDPNTTTIVTVAKPAKQATNQPPAISILKPLSINSEERIPGRGTSVTNMTVSENSSKQAKKSSTASNKNTSSPTKLCPENMQEKLKNPSPTKSIPNAQKLGLDCMIEISSDEEDGDVDDDTIDDVDEKKDGKKQTTSENVKESPVGKRTIIEYADDHVNTAQAKNLSKCKGSALENVSATEKNNSSSKSPSPQSVSNTDKSTSGSESATVEKSTNITKNSSDSPDTSINATISGDQNCESNDKEHHQKTTEKTFGDEKKTSEQRVGSTSVIEETDAETCQKLNDTTDNVKVVGKFDDFIITMAANDSDSEKDTENADAAEKTEDLNVSIETLSGDEEDTGIQEEPTVHVFADPSLENESQAITDENEKSVNIEHRTLVNNTSGIGTHTPNILKKTKRPKKSVPQQVTTVINDDDDDISFVRRSSRKRIPKNANERDKSPPRTFSKESDIGRILNIFSLADANKKNRSSTATKVISDKPITESQHSNEPPKGDFSVKGKSSMQVNQAPAATKNTGPVAKRQRKQQLNPGSSSDKHITVQVIESDVPASTLIPTPKPPSVNAKTKAKRKSNQVGKSNEKNNEPNRSSQKIPSKVTTQHVESESTPEIQPIVIDIEEEEIAPKSNDTSQVPVPSCPHCLKPYMQAGDGTYYPCTCQNMCSQFSTNQHFSPVAANPAADVQMQQWPSVSYPQSVQQTQQYGNYPLNTGNNPFSTANMPRSNTQQQPYQYPVNAYQQFMVNPSTVARISVQSQAPVGMHNHAPVSHVTANQNQFPNMGGHRFPSSQLGQNSASLVFSSNGERAVMRYPIQYSIGNVENLNNTTIQQFVPQQEMYSTTHQPYHPQNTYNQNYSSDPNLNQNPIMHNNSQTQMQSNFTGIRTDPQDTPQQQDPSVAEPAKGKIEEGEEKVILGEHGTITSVGTYKCTLCDKYYFKESVLKTHLRTALAHRKSPSKSVKSGKQSVKNKSITSQAAKKILSNTARKKLHKPIAVPYKITHQCRICRVEFETKKELMKHTQTHKKTTRRFKSGPLVSVERLTSTEIERATSPKKNSNTGESSSFSVSESNSEEFKCDNCLRTFRTLSLLQNHSANCKNVTVSAVTDRLPCEYCTKSFKTYPAYEKHVAKCHEDDGELGQHSKNKKRARTK